MTNDTQPSPTPTTTHLPTLRPHPRSGKAITDGPTKRRIVGAAVVAAGGVLLLGACGDDESATTLAEGTGTFYGRNIELSATEDDGEVSGEVEVTAEDEPSFTITFTCMTEATDDVVIVGGEVSKSDDDERPKGMRAAILLKKGDPNAMGMWFEDPPPTDSCDEFVESIPDEAVTGPDSYEPLDFLKMG